MKSLINVNIQPGLQLCPKYFGVHNISLFQPFYLTHQANHIMASMYQFDSSRLHKILNYFAERSSKTQKNILQINIHVVSTNTMLSLPPANADENQIVAGAGARFRDASTHPFLNENATDILAFPTSVEILGSKLSKGMDIDPLSQELISCEEEEEEEHPHQQQQLMSFLNCGDIVCCPVQMLAALGPDSRRCNQVGTMKEYLLCALTHSMLHLFGYNHLTMEQRDEMVAMERKIARCVVEWNR